MHEGEVSGEMQGNAVHNHVTRKRLNVRPTQPIKPRAHLRVHRLLSGVVLAAEPPVHEDPPELHVEDDGVASEQAKLLLQRGPLLGPGHLVTLKSLQLQTATLGL